MSPYGKRINRDKIISMRTDKSEFMKISKADFSVLKKSKPSNEVKSDTANVKYDAAKAEATRRSASSDEQTR